jgi:hypothetical protein
MNNTSWYTPSCLILIATVCSRAVPAGHKKRPEEEPFRIPW